MFVISGMVEAPMPWALAAVFATIAGVGVLAGGKFASLLPEKSLRFAFASLVLLTAAFVFWRA